jgi:hypothetical protein
MFSLVVSFPSLQVTAHGNLRMRTRWCAVRKHVLILFRANSKAFRAMTDAVNCWPVSAEAQVRFQASVCVFACVGFLAYKVAL